MLDDPVVKLSLGCAQLGMNYGVSNTKGQVNEQEASHILKTALKHNITTLDTAYNYGNSETVIGNSKLTDSFQVSTKASLNQDIKETFKKSLKNLNTTSIHSLLIHDPFELNENNRHQIEKLIQLKKEGLVHNIGLSLYSESDYNNCLDFFKPDIVQLPLNIFDQSLIKSGFIKKLKSSETEIHVRSVFLQGLAFINPEKIHPYFTPIKSILADLHFFAKENNYSIADLLLNFVFNIQEIDKIVIGVTSTSELLEVISSLNKEIAVDYGRWIINDKQYTNPANWKLNE